MATQTYASLSNEQQTFYQRALLDRMLPNLTFNKYGLKKSIPENSGTSTEFRKFNSIEIPAASLTEGVTPAGSALNITKITATLSQEGDFVEVSDVLDMAGKDKVITETAQLLGEQAARKLETITYEELIGGTNVVVANSKTRETILATDVATVKDCKRIVRALKNANIPTVDGNCYIGVFHPNAAYDLANDPDWVDISKYAANTQLLDGEIGKIGGLRVIESTLIKSVKGGSGSDIDVYQNVAFGKDAFGIVDLDGKSKPKIMIHDAKIAGGALEQRSTIGWKAMFTAKRLQELGIVRFECAVSD